jgi:hypothetical protein
LFFAFESIYSNNQIEISLLTCSKGVESFSTWGHSALRIVDKENSTDVVYNFGLFDFDTPNFHAKFIKGNLKYKLGAHDTYRFIQSYVSEDRQVIEQKFDLTDESEIKIIRRLEYLYKPENKYYYYNFLQKNCTSELRDLIFENIESDFQNTITNKSYRNQLDEFMTKKPWLRLGINLIFGTSVDKKTDKFQSMFLPDYLCWELNNVKVNGKELVYSQQIFNELESEDLNYPFLLNPVFLFSLLLLAVIFLKSPQIRVPILVIIGLLGLLILSVWSITEHVELKGNFNILWCNPLYLALLFKRNVKLQKYLAIVLQFMIVVVIVIWISRIQILEIAFIPILIILSIYNLRIINGSFKFINAKLL